MTLCVGEGDGSAQGPLGLKVAASVNISHKTGSLTSNGDVGCALLLSLLGQRSEGQSYTSGRVEGIPSLTARPAGDPTEQAV